MLPSCSAPAFAPTAPPSLVLRSRVETAAALYKRGLVRKLVMSGDNSLASYDEVSAMKDYAPRPQVPGRPDRHRRPTRRGPRTTRSG